MSARCAPHPATGFMTRRFFVRDSRPRAADGAGCPAARARAKCHGSNGGTRPTTPERYAEYMRLGAMMTIINTWMRAFVGCMHAEPITLASHIYIYIDLAHTEKPVAFYGLQVCARQRLALRREGVNQF